MNQLHDFGIPDDIIDIWKKSESEDLLPVQERSVKEGLLRGGNFVIVASSSSGKTFIGEMAAIKAALDGKRAIYLTPLKALAEEKYREFTAKYSDYGITVYVSTSDHQESDEEITRGEFDIAIIVHEKLSQLLVRSPKLLAGVGLVVIDEAQLLADKNRGPTLEMVLTKSSILNPKMQLVCLSATVSNADALAKWLSAKSIVESIRPIELREGVFLQGIFRYREYNTGNINEEVMQTSSTSKSSDVLCALAKNLAEQGEQVLVFVNNKPSSVDLAVQLAKSVNLPPLGSAITELDLLENTLQTRRLKETLRSGVAFHNSDLLAEEREVVERNFREGGIKITVATTTLAMGLNLPAKTVIFSEATKWDDESKQYIPLSVIEYKNMAGRAGRYKLQDKFGRAIMVATNKLERDQSWRRFIGSTPEPLEPRLKDIPLETQVLNLVASGLCSSEQEAQDILLKTFTGFLYWTDKTYGQYVKDRVHDAVTLCVKYGMMAETTEGGLTITDLGKAAALEGISPETFRRIMVYLEIAKGKEEPINLLQLLYVAATTDAARPYLLYYNMRVDAMQINKAFDKQVLLPEDEKYLKLNPHALIIPFKTALCMKGWVEGELFRILEGAYHSSGGQIRRAGEGLSWVVHAMALIASKIGLPDEKVQLIQRLSLQLEYGVPDDLLDLARLDVPGLRRGDLKQLRDNGFTSYEKILEAGIDGLQKVISAKLAAELLAGISTVTQGNLDKKKIEHIARLERLGIRTDTVKSCYEAEGKQFSGAVCQLLKDVGLNTEYLEEDGEHTPDILLHFPDGSVPIQCCARSGVKRVTVTKSGEILSQGASYKPIAYAVVGRPGFDANAMNNCVKLSEQHNYKMFDLEALCELIVSVFEKKLTKEQLVSIIKGERGYIQPQRYLHNGS